jgi:hypothetical protein
MASAGQDKGLTAADIISEWQRFVLFFGARAGLTRGDRRECHQILLPAALYVLHPRKLFECEVFCCVTSLSTSAQANIVINLLTWFVDYQYGWRLFEVSGGAARRGLPRAEVVLQAQFNWARAGTLIIDVYWMYYFHRYLKSETGKPPIQSDVTLLIVSLGMSFVLMHYMQVWATVCVCVCVVLSLTVFSFSVAV